jgi:hypothetical protein
LAVFAAPLVPSLAAAADWPTFRGPERTAVAPDTDLLETWPAAGPRLLWEAAGAGRGYASPAIAGNRIYTLGDGLSTATDKDEYLSCFDRETGKQLWKTKTGQPWNEGAESWQGSRSTPTVDGDMVYVITPQGQLVACATADGKERFRIDLKAQFGGKKGDSWGYSESPLVDDNRLVCTPGGEQATLVALDKKTGGLIWSCPMRGDRGAGHSSIVISQPVVSQTGGRKVYVQTTAAGAFAVDAQTGKFQWAYPIDQTTAVIPTPIVRGDLVFFSAGYKRGGALLRQVPGADGGVTMAGGRPHLWRLRRRGHPVLCRTPDGQRRLEEAWQRQGFRHDGGCRRPSLRPVCRWNAGAGQGRSGRLRRGGVVQDSRQ